MDKYKYADTVKINVKPDGSVVCSLYVNDSKDKKEHYKNAARIKKAAGSNGSSKKKRTVTVSKSTKSKHKDKLTVESYLQANSWEYVLRVPVTSVDHQTTWRKFMQRYGYKYKDRKLQYVMIKGDGELYGAISNAPVENGKIPLVNVEHSIVSAYDKSVLKQLTGLSLQYKYKGKEHSYVSSNGLKEKTFEFVNLGGIEYFSLPDDALVTQMQASLVFNGGTVEENLEAARRFIEEKKVENVADKNEYKAHIRKELSNYLKYQNRFKGIAASVVKSVNELEITEPITTMFELKERTVINAMYQGQTVYREVNGESMLDRFSCIYIIFHKETGKIYYVGLAKEPLNRYCDHFGLNVYKDKDGNISNTSDFFKYIKRNVLDFNDYSIGFIPSGFWTDQFGNIYKTEMLGSWNAWATDDIAIKNSSFKGGETDIYAEHDEAVVQCFYYNEYLKGNIDLYIASNGLPLYWKNEYKKQRAEQLAANMINNNGPVPYIFEEMKRREENGGKAIWRLEEMFLFLKSKAIVSGDCNIESLVFREIVEKQAAFLRLKGFDLDLYMAKIKNNAEAALVI